MEKHCKSGRFIRLMASMFIVLICSASLSFAAEQINVGFITDFSGTATTLTMQEAPVVEMAITLV